jgi:prepilin-type N-terminal cleavage/methylation domain-containing protein
MRRAFTLIELLVVITIIAILAAILFPVFASAKRSAKQASCISNLHQAGAATSMYMADDDDVFPNALDASDKWAPEIWDSHPEWQQRIPSMPLLVDVLQPYCKSTDVFRCPGDIGTEVLDQHFINGHPEPFPTKPKMWNLYKSSYFFRTEIAFRALTQTNFQLPANVNYLFDGAGHWHSASRALRLDDDFETFLQLTHDYRYNCLFGDFHVKSLNADQLQNAWSVQL